MSGVEAYAVLYPYAVICMAITASVMTIFSGGVAWSKLTLGSADWSPDVPVSMRIIGGAAVFVGSCLAAMVELKIGAWVASVGCQ